MTINCWPLDAVSSNPNYTGEMLRQTTGGVIGGKTATRTLGARSGVWPGTPSTVVSIASTTVTVGVHGGVMDAETSATAGPYVYAVSVAPTLTINAADATNPRIDLISLQLSDPAEGDGTSTPGVAAVYTAGTAASSPVAPSAPARSLVLAQVNVPHSGGGAATITFVAPYAVAAGGIIPVASSAQYPAAPYEGNYVDDASLNALLRYTGSAWVVAGASFAERTQEAEIIPTGTASTTGSGSATWAASNGIIVPAWATKALIHFDFVNMTTPASALNVLLQLKIGSAGGRSFRIPGSGAASTSFCWGFTDVISSGLVPGGQVINMVDTFSAGTGVFSMTTASLVTFLVEFLP